jgi:hypothetical protein
MVGLYSITYELTGCILQAGVPKLSQHLIEAMRQAISLRWSRIAYCAFPKIGMLCGDHTAMVLRRWPLPF